MVGGVSVGVHQTDDSYCLLLYCMYSEALTLVF